MAVLSANLKSPVRGNGSNSVKGSPNSGLNKRKRIHPIELHENECGQLNRSQDESHQSILFTFKDLNWPLPCFFLTLFSSRKANS